MTNQRPLIDDGLKNTAPVSLDVLQPEENSLTVKGKPVSKETVVHHAIEHQVCGLRKEIEANPKKPEYTPTVWGRSYRLT